MDPSEDSIMASSATSFNIEKGDNLFEVVFEFDRQLQVAQKFDSPAVFLVEIYASLEEFLIQASKTQPDVVDTIFLKLVDFFIKCDCNYKRLKLTRLLDNPQTAFWIKSVINRSESLKRLCHLWDISVSNGDYESLIQILNFLNTCSSIYFNLPAVYGMFYEAFSALDPVAFATCEEVLISACSSCFQALFQSLNSNLTTSNEREVDKLIEISKFASKLVMDHVFSLVRKKSKRHTADLYRILLICALISNNIYMEETIKTIVPLEYTESLKDVLIYF